jgi:DNA helicase IV
MSLNLGGSEIVSVKQKGEKIEIQAEGEKKIFDLSSIFDVEVQLPEEDDDISGIAATLGTIAGFVAGDFTGAIGGGFSGWLAGKLFSKEKIYFLSIVLVNDEKITFTSKENLKDVHLSEIQDIYNEFLLQKIKDNINSSKKWANNLKVLRMQKKYISFSDIFKEIDKGVHRICEKQGENIDKSNLLDINNQRALSKYLVAFKSVNLERRKVNDLFIKNNLNNINLKGLILSQKKAVLTDDDSTLINAGAGSGKTKTILHKLAYLLDNKMCKPEEVLVLAYNRNVMHELKERISSFGNKNIKRDLEKVAKNSVKTFHGYGFRQIKGKKSADFIEKKSDFESEYKIKKGKELDKIIAELFTNKEFKDNLLTYFSEYFFTYKDYFKDIENYDDYIKYIRNIGQVTLNGNYMRSYEEIEIANYLFINGIKFEYEKEYEGQYLYESENADFSIKDKNHQKRRSDKKYHPDFYLTDYKIYLEHFALNKQNEAPSFFKNPQGYYEQYLEKIKVHKNNKTKLITTFSWEKSEGNLLKNLEKKLKKHKVKFKKMNNKELMKIFKSSGKLSRFTELVSTFLSHYKSNELTDKVIKNRIIVINGDNNKRRCLVFLELFLQIFEKYQSSLKKEKSIDFDDMIIEGRKKLEIENFKYVIVDEFQDISQGRAKFLKRIKELNNAKLFCVGDDWQAINQFSGGDVTIFTLDFENLYGYFERVDVDTTFRYGNLINNISSKFVQKNPSQLKKKVQPFKDIRNSINIYEKDIFTETMNKITKKYKNIFILGRYNLDKYDNSIKKRLYKSNISTKYEINKFVRNKSLNVNYKTIHAAKGLESDVVCIVNMFPGILGFPSQIENDEILYLVLPNPEKYPNAEERRLMYVAMTRAKKEVHLFSGNGFYSSEFIKELKKEYPSFDDNKNIGKKNTLSKNKCPKHNIRLVKRNGYKGPFYGCPKYFSEEKCRYTENA